MQGDIVSQGLELMIYGMGTVVVFLTLLIVATRGMSLVVSQYFPEPVVVPPARKPSLAQGGDDPQVVAAISVAIARHRAKRQ